MIRSMMIIPAILIFNGCTPPPEPTIEPLDRLPRIKLRVVHGRLDKNSTKNAIIWMQEADEHDKYYHTETVRLKRLR